MLNLERYIMGSARSVSGEQALRAEGDMLAGPRKTLEMAGITVNFLGMIFAVFSVGGFLFFLFVPFANPYIGLIAFIGMPVLFIVGAIMYIVGGFMEGYAKKARKATAQ